jgi:hypothetical protein
MGILTTGTQLSQAIAFNTGSLDINGMEVATLQDITITASFALKEIRQLGSIKMAVAPKRSTWKPSAKFKAKSINQALIGFLFGSSLVDGSGFDYNIVDGQVVLSRASVKCYINDTTAQTMEFQFTNAVIGGSSTVGFKMEDAAEFDLEITSQDMTVVTNFSTQ